MRSEQLKLDGEPAKLASELRALVPAPASVSPAVAEIIARVRSEGDRALLEYTRRFDTRGSEPKNLAVSDAELEQASSRLEPDVREGLERAIENVRRVGEAELDPDRTVDLGTHRIVLRREPVARAAVYVPGGRAPYPSTVVMGVVAARVAGVEEVSVCTPPTETGELDDAVLGACKLAGASIVYRMGGAQAIAALAYGTESVRAVDVIVGPGNLYVQEAKLQVFGQVGIDGFAGPSDLVLVADADVDARLPTLDLLAQAEHGEGTLVVGISTSAPLLEEIAAGVAQGPDTDAVLRLIQVADDLQALALAEELAPEHLQLIGPRAERLAPRVTHAGCLFVGAAAGTAFGDYIAGSNHVLPTNGAARFASALSPATFRRRFAEVMIDNPTELAKAAAPVARAEGFELHARSMEARIRDNGSDG